jgi:hypothetical protein
MRIRFATVVVLSATVAILPATIRAQKGDLTHEHAVTPNAEVGFGVFPTTRDELGQYLCEGLDPADLTNVLVGDRGSGIGDQSVGIGT